MREIVKIMFGIKSIILFIVLSVQNSNQASVKEMFEHLVKMTIDPSENKIARNESATESGNENKQMTQYSPIDPAIDEDAKLSVPELITKYGYKAEVHYVTTEDGYIVQLHRIAGGERSPPRKGKKVVYWMHGLGDSSAGVIIAGPGHSLGYLLADNDYDVWLGNARGTTYSANHTTLNPFGSMKERDRFWQFSWHEIGVYDASASIDYILAKTGESKVQFIGHSQGGTVFFVLASERPEYNDKIEMMHALAPSVFLSNIITPAIRVIVPFVPVAERIKELIGAHFISPSKEFRVLAGELLCRDKMPTQIICENLLFLVMGYESDQMNSTLLPILLGHVPAGCATNQFIHFGQVIYSGHFRPYDYGPDKNILKYKRSTPPDYNLTKITTPVALYYSQNDWMTTIPDIHILMKKLPNLVKRFLVPHKKFNHLDFLVGTQAPTLVYSEILKTMKASHENSKL